jgi:site-specific recombinase XerD
MKAILLAMFDQVDFLSAEQPFPSYLKSFSRYRRDFKAALSFLYAYKDIKMTYGAYRREIERFLHWSWQISKNSIFNLKRADIEAYAKFCQHPRSTWIGLFKCHRFIETEGKRVPNPAWRPFVATVTKSEHKKGKKPKIGKFEFSSNSLKELFAILSSFYNYLLREECAKVNPVALIRQKSKFIRKIQGQTVIRRLSE